MKHIAAYAVAAAVGILWIATAAHAVVGDYNDNGRVDAADYTVWRDNVGRATPLPNDPIGGEIGIGQYDQWVDHFGEKDVGATPPPPVQPGPSDPQISLQFLGVGANGWGEWSVGVQQMGGGSLAVEIAINAPVHQVQFMGFDVDTNVDAESFDGEPGYDKADDTWYNIIQWNRANPGQNPLTGTITEGYVDSGSGNSLFISLGGNPTTLPDIELLHLSIEPPSGSEAPLTSGALAGPQAITAPASFGQWSGVIAQDGVLFASDGAFTVVPEPGSLVLLVAPAAVLMARRRRARQSI